VNGLTGARRRTILTASVRALVAAILAVTLVVAAAAPHVHAQTEGGGECATCVLRHTDSPRSDGPNVAPLVQAAGEVPCAPGLSPVAGFPLGAIPGQSPPAVA
jgi:hypothetical protein